VALALALASAAASAQQVNGTVNGTVGITGQVTNFSCTLGPIPAGDNVFDLGVLIDTSTGRLRSDLSVPPKTISGSFCNARSVITVSATRMRAQSFSGSLPSGFSNAVDYQATASGWTDTPAVYATGSVSNTAASQIQPLPFTGDITISLSDFTTTGGNLLRLVSDPLYQGTVTVTLTVAS